MDIVLDIFGINNSEIMRIGEITIIKQSCSIPSKSGVYIPVSIEVLLFTFKY